MRRSAHRFVMEETGRGEKDECQDDRNHYVVMNAAARIGPPDVAANCPSHAHEDVSLWRRASVAQIDRVHAVNHLQHGCPEFNSCVLRLCFATVKQALEKLM